MRKLLVFLLMGSGLLLNACGKTDSGCQPATVASEKTAMVAYCSTNGINYKEDPSGILYEIVLPGSAPAPTLSSTISTVYTGKLLNGATFDAAANPVTFQLSGVIDGWKIGIPLIKKGGRIKMVIPSALAYGCTGSGNTIAPNSPLFFDVTLTDVK